MCPGLEPPAYSNENQQERFRSEAQIWILFAPALKRGHQVAHESAMRPLPQCSQASHDPCACLVETYSVIPEIVFIYLLLL